MKKRVSRGLCPAFPSARITFPDHCLKVRNARRSLMTERSERMSEEASFHPLVHFSLVTP